MTEASFAEFAKAEGIRPRWKCSYCSLPDALRAQGEQAWLEGYRNTPQEKFYRAQGHPEITSSVITHHFGSHVNA